MPDDHEFPPLDVHARMLCGLLPDEWNEDEDAAGLTIETAQEVTSE